jgi:hypothetical protein
MSTPILAALFIGWGLEFVVLLDHDTNGTAAKEKLISELGVDKRLILQPKNAAGIEDLFSSADFQTLLKQMDDSFSIKLDEKPTAAIKRLKLDKILVGRTFADLVGAGKIGLDAETLGRIDRLFAAIAAAWKEPTKATEAKAVSRTVAG